MTSQNIEMANLNKNQEKYSLLVDENKIITYKELIYLVYPFALKDIQTLASSHYTQFKETFVIQQKIVSETEYEQVITLVESIPGATTSQLMIALGTIAKKNAFGGIIALLAFTLPGAIILLILGYIYSFYPDPRDLNIFILLAIQGVKSATVALILQLWIHMGMNNIRNKLNICIAIISAVALLIYQQPFALIITMLLGGMTCLMVEYDSENTIGRRTFQKDPQPSMYNDPKSITVKNCHKISSLLGNKAVHLYLVILLILLYLNSTQYSIITDISLAFYSIGTFMIGGTPITLPFMYAETVVNPLYINADAFWLGFGLAASLPGPYLNFAIFIGTHSLGIGGGICCWVAIFVPSILQIWGLLPQWQNLRNNSYFGKFKEGVVCVAVGFLATAIYHAWIDACKYDGQTATIISFLSLVYLTLLNFNCPGVMSLGAILFIVRYLALWYYRELDPIIFK